MDTDAATIAEIATAQPAPLPSNEPLKASIRRRLLGWLIDYAVVMVPGVTIVVLAAASVVQSMAGYVGAVGAEVGWERLVRLITHRGEPAGVLRAAASGEWVSFTMPLLAAIVLVPVLQFIYQGTLLAWRGRTLGKIVADTRVGLVGAPSPRMRGGAAVRRALGTTFLETGLISLALVAAVIGQLSIGTIIWAAAFVAFWINAVAVFGARRRSVVDRIAGTVVVRKALYAQVAERAVDFTRRASDTATAAGRRSSEAAVTAGRRTADVAVTASQTVAGAAVTAGQTVADAAVVAGQLARQGAEAVARSAPVQQVRDSRVGQQAQAVGAIGAEQARKLRDQASTRARRLGGGVKELWQDRQSKRQPDQPEPPELPELPETTEG